MINVRKLAAIDILFLGPKFILAEFGLGVLLLPAFGIFTILRGHSVWQTLFGAYLLSLGVNYVPLLLYGIAIARHHSARAELGDELVQKDRAMRRYRLQSLLLLIPFLVPLWLLVTSAGANGNAA